MVVQQLNTKRPAVVIGGGIAGLSAAFALQQKGVPVVVLEATPHVGGRIHSVTERGGRLETGMQFYYSAYSRTHRLLRTLGLHKDLVPIHIEGFIHHGGRSAYFSKTRPWLSLLNVRENLALQATVARQLVPLLGTRVFSSKGVPAVDDVDAAAHFEKHCGNNVLEVAIRPLINSYAFCEPEEHSLAMMLRILKLGAFASTCGLRQGNDALPAALASRLTVVHGSATQIHVNAGKVEGVSYTQDGQEHTLATPLVICATRAPQAAALLGGVTGLSAALEKLSYSSVVLVNLFLDRPLQDRPWAYVLSRQAGHRGAFAVDLQRRMPQMFPDGRSVLQVNFATPNSDALLGADDDALAHQAMADMKVFVPEIGSWVKHASVVRRPNVLPNFKVGSRAVVRTAMDLARGVEGLHLAGDYLRSPLCESAVRSGEYCAQQVMNPQPHPMLKSAPAPLGAEAGYTQVSG